MLIGSKDRLFEYGTHLVCLTILIIGKFHTSYTNFAIDQPSKDRDNNCFVMSSAHNWRWATVNCHMKLPFACMICKSLIITIYQFYDLL